jgi:hypothetical protein
LLKINEQWLKINIQTPNIACNLHLKIALSCFYCAGVFDFIAGSNIGFHDVLPAAQVR